ncbi:MAG: gephyrin-like molybdotransferase Glp [Anaerolineae bacterium]
MELTVVESKYPMIPVEEALRIVLEHTPVLEPRAVPFDRALGLVLAEDIRADEDMPPFPASAKDGYAVVAADRSPMRRLVGEQTAGFVADLRVEPGTAARITTGAPLPPGADAVVMVEFTEEYGDQVAIRKRVKAGDDVRPAGQDIARGELVLRRGTLLGAAEVGLLATIGYTVVKVYPHPKVAVLSTGNELVEPHQTPGPGEIRDSNRYALLAAVERAGAESISLGMARDEVKELEAKVREGLDKADVLLTSGGVSMGKLDLVKPLLERLGTVHFGRVFMKPGKPVTFATVGERLVFALPGFPVSSQVAFELFVRPALLKMAGHARLQRPRREVILTHDIRHSRDRTEYQRAAVTSRDGQYYATTTGSQVSGRLLSMVGANALLRLPHGHGDFAVGQKVEAILIGEIDG